MEGSIFGGIGGLSFLGWGGGGVVEEEERSPSFFGVNAKMAEVGNGAVR